MPGGTEGFQYSEDTNLVHAILLTKHLSCWIDTLAGTEGMKESSLLYLTLQMTILKETQLGKYLRDTHPLYHISMDLLSCLFQRGIFSRRSCFVELCVYTKMTSGCSCLWSEAKPIDFPKRKSEPHISSPLE